mmetsp:Transcript_498/g.2336  ORF Transcript_498/g.2336 Transcript_498/m.2336 type:complete len:200 (-) Transcript_498:166-765(-)
MASHRISPGLICPTSRLCSASSLLFQYTSPKSSLNGTPCCRTSVSRLVSPASSSHVGTLNSLSIAPTLFTIVLSRGFLSSNTRPMTCLYAVTSSRRLRCAMCPTVSNDPGTSHPSGSSLRRTCSALKYSYDSTSSCVVRSSASTPISARLSSLSSSVSDPSLTSSFSSKRRMVSSVGSVTTDCCRGMSRTIPLSAFMKN